MGDTELHGPTLALTTDELLTTTRAVRKRLDLERPVSRAVVEECAELAFQAPNGSNQQRWQWVFIDDPKVRADAAAIYRAGLQAHLDAGPLDDEPSDYGSPEAMRIGSSVQYLIEHLHEVPVLLVPAVRARLDNATIFYQGSIWGSVIQAVWSFMLALRSRGMGSAWTTLHLHREQEMAELLGIPYDRYTQVGLFPVAYTIGTDFRAGARSRSDGAVSWNRFTADS